MARGRRRVGQQVEVEWYGDQFLEIVEKHGDAAVFAAGEVLLREAVSNAPRKSGRLAGSGYVATASKSTYRKRRYWRKEKTPPRHGAVIAFTAPHAHLMESGRRKVGPIVPRTKGGKHALRVSADGQLRARSRYRRMAARPFVGPAIDATKDSMAEEIAKVLNQRLESEMPK
jgi:hypothetical protein